MIKQGLDRMCKVCGLQRTVKRDVSRGFAPWLLKEKKIVPGSGATDTFV